MKVIRRAAILAATCALAFSAPALADDPWPNVTGDYVSVSMISVQDGHDLDYMNYLAGSWRKSQDFAKAQGWITSYEILANVHRRAGEPDYYLVVRFPRFADKAEEDRRDAQYFAHMQTTTAQQQAGSADRAKYRTQMGSQLLRDLPWKP